MRIATSTTHEVTLEGDEIFDVRAQASYSGNMVTARISRIVVTKDEIDRLEFRLHGFKVKRDGTEGQVPFEYWPTAVDVLDVWLQIPGAIRASLPHSVQFARAYLGKQGS